MQTLQTGKRVASSSNHNLVSPRGPMTTLSIVMPVYNERATIAQVVRTVLQADSTLEKELVIVDDCSTDGTREVLRELEVEVQGRIKLVFHKSNQGKGAALRT